MLNADTWIEKLGLTRHPEGGYFRETYRAAETIAAAHLPERFTGPRCFSTSIYFMLVGRDFSAFHRIKQDEIWHFYTGSPLCLHVLPTDRPYYTIKLGQNIMQGETLQAVIKAGDYFGAELLARTEEAAAGSRSRIEEPTAGSRSGLEEPAAAAFALTGCTVAPGFDFADFEMPNREALIRLFPRHEPLIKRLTHI